MNVQCKSVVLIGMTENIVGCSIPVVNTRPQYRPDPDDLLRRTLELRRTPPQRFQPRQQLFQRFGVKAGSDLAAILQFAIDPFAERERGKAFGGFGHVAVAEGLGCKAIRVKSPNEFADAFERAQALMEEHQVPVVIEFILERVTNIAMTRTRLASRIGLSG